MRRQPDADDGSGSRQAGRTWLAAVWRTEASQVEQMWGSADMLRANSETDAVPSLSSEQMEFDVGYGL